MLDWLKTKIGPLVVGLVIALLTFAFGFEGVFTRGKLSGMSENAVAGAVNGENISLSEFNKALERRTEFFKNMMGGKVSEQQIKAFRLREAVFSELVNRKLMAQAASDAGMTASDAEVRARVQEMDVFHKDGNFDLATYRNVLLANNLNEVRFENMMREDLSVQQWDRYFSERAKVSEEEAKRDYLSTNNKRDIKFVMITEEAVAKSHFTDAEALKFAHDPANQATIKSRYDAGKSTQFKTMPEEQAKVTIAREMMAEKGGAELKAATEKLADQAVAAMGNEAQLKALLKPYGLEPHSTGMVASSSRFLPGVGEAPELMKDAFAPNSAIEGHAKKYITPQGTIVAIVTGSQHPDLAKFASERDSAMQTLATKKVRELMEVWMKQLISKAKIERNKEIVGEADDAKG